ncbi:MAG: SHOCT domain-containing protein [Arthrobacter sp.]|uniref:SHOCT domain-containing protein n=1 Tax=Arthrobacter sp. TaxID=1667 RepID=UPI00348189F8
MAGLLRGVARTAVVAGTATAVSGRVQRRQAARFSDSDAQLAAQRQQAYEEQVYRQQAPPPPPPPAPPAAGGGGGNDVVEQLKALASLKDQGILTEEEFAGQKAKILGM